MEYKFLNDREAEDIQMMTTIINALAVADGFPDLDACLAKHPDRLDTYKRYGSAALRAVRHVQEFPIRTIIDEAKKPASEFHINSENGAKS